MRILVRHLLPERATGKITAMPSESGDCIAVVSKSLTTHSSHQLSRRSTLPMGDRADAMPPNKGLKLTRISLRSTRAA
jgi:hypothetical protein